MPPAIQFHQEDTILRNARLICRSKLNIFIIFVNPVLAYLFFYCLITYQWEYGLITFRRQFHIAFFYMLFACLSIMVLGEQVKEKLEQEGYVQRRTRRREIDLYMNYAICAAWIYWVFKMQRRSDAGKLEEALEKMPEFFVRYFAAFMALAMWASVVLFSFGRVLWFTVRVR